MFECNSFPCPEVGSVAFLSRLLPLPRTIGTLGCSRRFVHGLDISTLVSFEVLTGTRAQSTGFVSISLMHLFRKKEGLGNATASLIGLSRGAH
jgi:hypothetical protein